MAAKENEKMTIEQVAEALGVSKTTVSRALSGKGRISEKTRAKVFAYMGHARTEPVSAQKDPKVRTNNIAMVVPQRFITLDLPFCANVWAASVPWLISAATTCCCATPPAQNIPSCSVSWRAIRWTVLF